MERKKYPHDRTKYLQLLQHTKDTFLTGDTDSLKHLEAQASSLHTEGYVNDTEKNNVFRLVRVFLEILAHPINQ